MRKVFYGEETQLPFIRGGGGSVSKGILVLRGWESITG